MVARPGARLPLLLGLLVLTAGLTGTAAFQFRREQELVRLRHDFTSSVSHELRTPLTQILLFGETLELGRARGEDAQREAVGVIVQEARRLAHLVENVLQLSRAERRLVRVRPVPTPAASAVREIVERFAPLAGAAAVRIRAELDETLVALADPAALHQIVINLLDNAVKHGGTGPITVRAARRAGRARLEVEDAGAGIPVAERQRIWEPFVRLRPADAVPGSGIGLAVVRELVSAHGGDCRIEDVAGGGSRFVVELPDAGVVRARRGSRARGTGGAVARILIVEDNRNLAHGLRTNLEFEGHVAEVAEDGAAGLALARTRGHDLVLLDLMLPALDGFRLLETIRSEGIETPVLVLTARGDESDKVRGLREGADDYVTKPFALRELLARVAALLRRARGRSAALGFGAVQVDPATRAVTLAGEPVSAPAEGVRPALRAPGARRARGDAGGAAAGSVGLPGERDQPDAGYPRRRAAAEAGGRSRAAAAHPHGAEDRISAGGRWGASSGAPGGGLSRAMPGLTRPQAPVGPGVSRRHQAPPTGTVPRDPAR